MVVFGVTFQWPWLSFGSLGIIRPMKFIKPIVIAALFIIGVIEFMFSAAIGLTFYALSPQTSRVFATPKQHQLYQIYASIYSDCQIVVYLGLATIVIAVLLLVADSKSKP